MLIQMKIASPQELGFPEKFDAWRQGQPEAIEAMLNPNRRVTAINASTGFGKSIAYVSAAIISKEPTCIVTESRGLQDQLLGDFAGVGLVDLRGASNYQCSMREDYTCEEGFAARCPLKGTMACERSHAETAASVSYLVTTNYAKWTSSKKFGQGMNHFTQVIFDEGHKAHDALASALQVTLHHREIEEGLRINFLMGEESRSTASWRLWAVDTADEAQAQLKEAKHRLDMPNPKPSHVKHYTHLRDLTRRLGTLSTMRPIDWVVEEKKEGFQFDPIRPGRYAEPFLLMRIPKVVFISATLRPKSLYMIGQSKNSFTFHEYDSSFDPKRCPVYYVPTMPVKYGADLGPLWIRYDQIAARRRDRKHLVHTVSYTRRDEIMARSRFGSSMMINPKGEPASEMVELFRESAPGTGLISPSIGSGYDFPMRDAEWQFVCKIPFLPIGQSVVLSARQHDDPEYRDFNAAQTFEQICGRIMRRSDDQGETFIGDDQMQWFKAKLAYFGSKSLMRRFQWVDYPPPPPPPL